MTPIIQKIVVPTDFTARSDQTVTYAASLAANLNAAVHLMHVIEEPFVAGGEWDLYGRDAQEVRERLYADVRSRLAAIAVRLEQQRLRVTIEIRHGSACDAIIDAAAAAGADLIVMSTHGRSGLPHLLLGSVAERVIRGAHCPGPGGSRVAARPECGHRWHDNRRVTAARHRKFMRRPAHLLIAVREACEVIRDRSGLRRYDRAQRRARSLSA